MSPQPQTYCKRGHPMIPGNVIPVKGGGRRCRTCRRMLVQIKAAAKTNRPLLPEGYRTPGAPQIGDQHPQAKLTLAEAVEIFHSTETTNGLARRYQVDAATIKRIRRGQRWAKAIQGAAQ